MNDHGAHGRHGSDRDSHDHDDHDGDEYGLPLLGSNMHVEYHIFVVPHTFPKASSYCVVFEEADMCLFGIGRNSERDLDYVHDCVRTQNWRENVDCHWIALAAVFLKCLQPSVLRAPVCLARKMVNANVCESGHDYDHGYVAEQTQAAHMLRP